MIRVHTASRLHFGLLALPSADAAMWPDHDGAPTLPRRRFGGVGLMVEKPGIDLTIEPASNWSAAGPLAERALAFAQGFCGGIGIGQPFQVKIAEAAPEHSGLGVGTQLGLAVARGLAELTGQPRCDAVTLAEQVGRGKRSALGVHGFDRGGFLLEAGKTSETGIAPLIGRWDFPADWAVLLILPAGLQGTHGKRELDAFAELARRQNDDRTTEALCRLVLLGLIPALLERDLPTFGAALYDFNRRAGESFRIAQGGLYANPRAEEIVRAARDLGVHGVGQSSWGPTIFAVVEESQAAEISDRLANKIGAAQIIHTKACNHAVSIENYGRSGGD